MSINALQGWPRKKQRGMRGKPGLLPAGIRNHLERDFLARLNRVCTIDVTICPECGGEARVIACIKDESVIDKILYNLQTKGALPPPTELPPAARASPSLGGFAKHRDFTCFHYISRHLG
jgi:hypothetical protein